MKYIRAALARIAGVFSKDQADDDLRDEMQAHLEMDTAENIRHGMNPDEARRQALSSGGLTAAAEAVRDQRGLPWVETSRPTSSTACARSAQPRLHGRRRGHAGVRHRRQHRDLQRRPRRPAQTAAPPRGRPARLPAQPWMDPAEGHQLLRAGGRDFRTGAPALGSIAEFSPWFGTLLGKDDAIRIDVGLVATSSRSWDCPPSSAA
jgi:hypothetical protein